MNLDHGARARRNAAPRRSASARSMWSFRRRAGEWPATGAPCRASGVGHFRLCRGRRHRADDGPRRGRSVAQAGRSDFRDPARGRTCTSSTRTAGASTELFAALRDADRAYGGQADHEHQTLRRPPWRNLPPGVSRSQLPALRSQSGHSPFRRRQLSPRPSGRLSRRLFNTGVDHDWAIVGAGVREPDVDMREKLGAQDWLTTVVEQEASATNAQRDRCDDRLHHAVRRRARCSRRSGAAGDPHRFADDHRGRLLHLRRRPSASIRASRHRLRREAR